MNSTTTKRLTNAQMADIRNRLRDAAPVFAARIAPIYSLMRWKWAKREGLAIPEESQILRSLLDSIAELEPIESKPDEASLSTGGYCVYALLESDETVSGGLTFTIEQMV